MIDCGDIQRERVPQDYLVLGIVGIHRDVGAQPAYDFRSDSGTQGVHLRQRWCGNTAQIAGVFV
jgi:hypothetical protein